jgi:hypothetical protein
MVGIDQKLRSQAARSIRTFLYEDPRSSFCKIPTFVGSYSTARRLRSPTAIHSLAYAQGSDPNRR